MTGCFGHNLVLAAFHGGVLVGSDSGAEFNSGDAQFYLWRWPIPCGWPGCNSFLQEGLFC